MKQAFNETLEKGPNCYQQMKSVAHVYSSRRECSLEEAVCSIPHYAEVWLRKFFRAGGKVNINLPKKSESNINSKSTA